MAHCWVLRQQGRRGCAAAYGLWCVLSGLFVSGFLAASSTHFVCGVCGLGLLFENYIVDASIFYKKQFPRIMNLDLSGRAVAVAFWLWWWCPGGFRGSLEN